MRVIDSVLRRFARYDFGRLRWTTFLMLAWFTGFATAQPVTRSSHAAAYDPLGFRMLVFGGSVNSQLTNELWTLGFPGAPSWSEITIGNAPSPRRGHSLTYDPVRNRMIVFGGVVGLRRVDAEVWALSLDGAPSWATLQPSGGPPNARQSHSAIYDPANDRIVVFGGADSVGNAYRDVWSLWLSPSPRWEQMTAGAGPRERHSHSAVYDPTRRRMLLFGGGIPALNDLWSLSLSDNPAWEEILIQGQRPGIRREHSAIFHSDSDAMVVFGGFDGNQYLNDTWRLSLSGNPEWSTFDYNKKPIPRSTHSVIHDFSNDRLVTFGGFPDNSEPTWALDLPEATAWSPFHSALNVSTTSLQLPAVSLGDTVPVTFRISSGGMSPLHVIGFESTDTTVRVSDPGPFVLGWREARGETLLIAGVVPGISKDTLFVMSDDPNAPRRVIELRSDVRDLSFGTRVLGDPAEAPLGESFIVVVTPDPEVTIEQAVLYHRIANSGADFDSVAFSALSSDFVAAVPAAAVTEEGVEYFAEVRNSGFRATQPSRVQAVARPSTMTVLPTSGSEFLEDRAIDVEVTLPDGAAMDTGELYYREGGQSDFVRATLIRDALGRPTATIPNTAVGASGLEYWVQVQTRTTGLRFPARSDSATPLRVKVQRLAEAHEHPGKRYRIFSLPLDFGADYPGSVYDLLSDQLGTYDRKRWRAFAYQPLAGGYSELSGSLDDRFPPLPGRAYWLVTRNPHLIDTAPVAGLSTESGQEFSISLQAGWNMFGNPFAFRVAWADVRYDTTVISDVRAFNQLLGFNGEFAPDRPAFLEPFEGYFIYAKASTTIWVKPRAAPTVQAEAVSSAVHVRQALRDERLVERQTWLLALKASTERSTDGSNMLGVDIEASRTWDRLDWRKPPMPPGDWVQASIVSAAGEPDRLERDLRPPRSPGETWEIEVRSSTAGEPVDIVFSKLLSTIAHPRIRVFDREQRTVVGDLPATDDSQAPTSDTSRPFLQALRHRIVSFGSASYRIAVAAGSSEYLDAVLGDVDRTPSRLTLDPVAPNPIRYAARIRFELPRAETVRLEVFDMAGRRVWAPFRGGTLEPGAHSLVWDGRTVEGGRVAPGLYVLRIAAGSESASRRMVIVR